jgi:5-methyltetrahydrofolate--homocysteine methyltransferase
VKSTVIMKENLEEMNRRGIATPVILGGAALTRAYVEGECRRLYQGPLYYAEDAFEGLSVMERIVQGEEKPAVRDGKAAPTAADRAEDRREAATRATAAAMSAATAIAGREGRPMPRSSKTWSKLTELPRDIDYPEPPFLGSRLIQSANLQAVLPYVNETTLFQFQWGYRRKGKALAAHKKLIQEHVRPLYFELAKQCQKERILAPQAAYGYWRCIPEGDTLVLLDPEDEGREAARFTFPRQDGKQNRCITDFFALHDGRPDVVALMVVTVGQKASDVAREWFASDRYQDYLHLHGLSVEVAEGLAEYVHRIIRGELGIAGDDAREMSVLFKQGYRGSRFSFGYPACPRLEDQAQLLSLLGADRIGITLSDEFQLEPEQSTSAIVCHHPSAKYFTL